MTVRIRAMEVADVDAVEVVADSLPHVPHWPRVVYLTATQGSVLPSRIGLVAEGTNGAITGFVLGTVLAPEAELELIAVAAGSQKQGIGAQMLSAWRRAVQSAGAERIVLEVRESNREARRFYEKAGFVQAGLRREYYRDPVEDAVLLSLDLNS